MPNQPLSQLLAEMKRCAEAATAGGWEYSESAEGTESDPDIYTTVEIYPGSGPTAIAMGVYFSHGDGHHIALSSPDNILRVLALVESLVEACRPVAEYASDACADPQEGPYEAAQEIRAVLAKLTEEESDAPR